jgi:hypothetical protein
MRNQGGLALEREIKKRKLRHADIEQMVGYKSVGTGFVTRLISGERIPTYTQSLIFKTHLGIAMDLWALRVKREAA